MAKLFAIEEENLGTGVDLEVSPEEGEVADVVVDTDAGAGDVGETVEAVDGGLEASAELEQVEAVVEKAVEEGEGLDPVAAEAIRIAVSAIASKVGANPKALYSLYASENFQAASSRRGNSTHALEGVQEFLKDLWKKIKAALNNLWTKSKAFWAKHISNVGRVKKALDSMKAKVKASSGKIDGKPYLDKAPSGLVSAVPGKGDLNAKAVEAYLSGIDGLVERAGVVADVMAGGGAKDLAAWKSKIDSAVGSSESYMVVGGDTLTIKYDADVTEGSVTLELEREPVSDKDEERGMVVADKGTLVSLLDKALASIKVTVDMQKKADKSAQAATTFMNDIEREIAASNEKGDAAKATRTKMRLGYKLSAFDAKIASIAASENVKACKGVLAFAAASLKQYK